MKITVIKLIRELTGFGLREAKLQYESGEYREEAFADLQKAVKLKQRLENAGCKVVITITDIDDVGTIHKVGFYKEG